MERRCNDKILPVHRVTSMRIVTRKLSTEENTDFFLFVLRKCSGIQVQSLPVTSACT
jgi:hypothetical protein